MMFGRVLITGGAGLIGSHIADALVGADAPEIVVLDDFSRGRRENLRRAADSGRLRIVLPEFTLPSADLFVYYPTRRNQAIRVRAFIDFLAAHFQGGQPAPKRRGRPA